MTSADDSVGAIPRNSDGEPLSLYECRECEDYQTKYWYGGMFVTGECANCFDGVWAEENNTLTTFELVEKGVTQDV